MKKILFILFVLGTIIPTTINAQTDLTESFNANALTFFTSAENSSLKLKVKEKGEPVAGDYFVSLSAQLDDNTPMDITIATVGDQITIMAGNDEQPDLLFIFFSPSGIIRTLTYDEVMYIPERMPAANDEKTEQIFALAKVFCSSVVQKFIEM